MLDVEQFLTGPDYIYLDQETGEAYFCYLPFYDGNLGEDFRKVTEYILKRLDHSEEAAVLLGYDIYSQSLDGDFSIGRLLKNVRKRGAGRETDHPKDAEADTGTERGFSDNHSAWETEEPEIAEEEEPPEKMDSGKMHVSRAYQSKENYRIGRKKPTAVCIMSSEEHTGIDRVLFVRLQGRNRIKIERTAEK